ncbi:MAG: methyltransferase domain-containing protein [Planctomycetota bacterium]
MTRLATEQAFHDEQAAQRRQALSPDALRFADDEYLDHESWVRPAFAWLGDPRGLKILDLGCGHGMAAVVLARRGAEVTGLDLSTGYLAEARSRAAANNVSAAWVQADAERLPFPDATFDRIWGHAILHHLDLPRVAAELERVLKPGGWAVACEPWGGNPLLRWARSRITYPGKARTPDETPLRADCLPIFRERFPGLEWQGHQLAGMLRRVLGDTIATRVLTRVDRVCLACCPPLRHWSRYVVLRLPRQNI